MEPEAPTSLAWLFERNDALVREAFRRGAPMRPCFRAGLIAT